MPPPPEHLNIKVTDNNNEVFFKIKRTTQLKKLMDAFCDRQGKQPTTVRFLFDGTRVQPTDTPEQVSLDLFEPFRLLRLLPPSGGRHFFNCAIYSVLFNSFAIRSESAFRI